jgi:PAS domain S-box-containing protein
LAPHAHDTSRERVGQRELPSVGDIHADMSKPAEPSDSPGRPPVAPPALAPGTARWEQLWSHFAEASGDLVAVVAQPSYTLEFLNRRGRELLKLPLEEVLIDRLFMEFVPNECLWTVLNELSPTAWRNGSWTGELSLRRTDGEEVPVTAMACMHRGSNGAPDTMIVTAHDTSEVKRALQILKRDQRYLRALLENVPDVIYFKDLESRFLRVNHAFSAKFGESTPDKLVGLSDFDYFTREHAEAAFKDEQEIIRTERPLLNFEEKETWPDGRVTWASTNKLPFYNEYGKVIGTFGITRDVTARKHAENALAESQRRLMDASRLAGMAEVASGVLHNVGNAFNSVNTSATLIADKLRDSRLANLARVAQLLDEHAHRLGEFFTEDSRGKQLPVYIKHLSRELLRERDAMSAELDALRKGVDHIKAVIAMQQSFAHASSLLEDLPVQELVEEALVISASGLGRHKVEVVRNFAPVLPVHAARHRVLEILVNLIRNAEHAVADAPVGERRIVFTIRPAEGHRVSVSVKDNGVGIAADTLNRIFSFGFTTKKTGHGFGLHNSALAAKEMNGTLTANSAGLGQGAEFVLILPTRETAETTAPIPPNSTGA